MCFSRGGSKVSPMARRVLLLYNSAKPEVHAALPRVRQAIASGGGVIVAELSAENESVPLGLAEAVTASKGASVMVTLGGDGTLLSQTRRWIHLDLPMLGVNFGKLGFLAEFDMASLIEQSTQLFDGRELEVMRRPLMEVRVLRSNADPHRELDAPFHLALNDAAIIAGPPHRMIRCALGIDGHRGPSILGDGLIICTPAGSTAYNVSAGGPILAVGMRCLCITAIAAHTLAFRPVVLPGNARVDVTLERANDPAPIDASGAAGAAGTVLLLDGRAVAKLHTGDRVLACLHEREAAFVTNPRIGYWETLSKKMHWATSPGAR